MQSSLDKVNELVIALNKLKPIKAEYQQKLDKKFRLEFNFNSNHLEGNTLTYNETELLLMFDDTKGGHQMREYEEMKAHDVAYKMINEWANETERPLTEQAIKNLNGTILVRPFWKEAITPDGQNTRREIKVGNYKEYPNSVRLQNGELFEYASPSETPILMNELMQWYRTEENNLHPVTLAAMLHYKFVRIHPFDDGNGRVSRLLMNYVLLKNNLPAVIIKSKEKNKYLQALHEADAGNEEAFIAYIAEQLVWSLEIYIKGAKGESISELGDFEKEVSQIELLLRNKKANVVKRSPEVIFSLYQGALKSLYLKIFQKLSKLNVLFSDFQAVVYKDNTGKMTKSESAYLKLLDDTFSIPNINFSYTSVSFRWEGCLLEGAEAFGESRDFRVDFGDYHYYINEKGVSTDKLTQVKKLYSENLTETEIDFISEELAVYVLARIKDTYKHRTGKELN
jgi:Fic family protein